jgi:hypothetical protein
MSALYSALAVQVRFFAVSGTEGFKQCKGLGGWLLQLLRFP